MSRRGADGERVMTGVAARDERGEASLEGRPVDEDVPLARLAAEPDIGAEAIDQPGVAAAGMRPTEADDVAEQQVQHGSVRHGGRVSEAGRP